MKMKKTNIKMHIKKGETVKIISGREKGKIGKIIKVLPKSSQVIIENSNIATKHLKAQKNGNSGQIIRIEKPIHISNVIQCKAHSNTSIEDRI
uniref:Large ribosomal subunit protein uL24c n=1 Tax=Agarophyton chilense TaxID=2510777 RepID=A0A141SEY8_AGACH|nr:ribosomal protein L24 [Agarophyton chilense]AMK96856.1 ribosomal protein L24 [Agarophyton chilense]ASP44750.1 50S ribosomal protein L24 [Agarophyton chilense]UAD84418.1 ribosomal protein L24 [Agarophyton chilense]